MSELPFELYKYHKTTIFYRWKKTGLIMDNFEEIYQKYIYATHCELCNKNFLERNDRCMEHNHETGEFRNICCQKCNVHKEDVKIQSNNSSGYKGISMKRNKKYTQGFIWVFTVMIDGKKKELKKMVDLQKLIEFAENWKKENNYYT